MLYRVLLLIGCRLVLAIRCHPRITGPTHSGNGGPATPSSVGDALPPDPQTLGRLLSQSLSHMDSMRSNSFMDVSLSSPRASEAMVSTPALDHCEPSTRCAGAGVLRPLIQG